jgi:ribosomal-protein-alanine N-acetyltransferase
VIRPATLDDRDALRDVRSWLAEPTPNLLEYALTGPPLLVVSTVESPTGSDTTGGRPVGYALALTSDEGAYVAEIAVDPAHRREGRATRLLHAVFDHARDRHCESVSLAVRADDDAARGLYASLGFGAVRREDEYYADGGDAVILRRPL